jgi:hypothetical protein
MQTTTSAVQESGVNAMPETVQRQAIPVDTPTVLDLNWHTPAGIAAPADSPRTVAAPHRHAHTNGCYAHSLSPEVYRT